MAKSEKARLDKTGASDEVEALEAAVAEAERWLQAELKELTARRQRLLDREKELLWDDEATQHAARVAGAINDISAAMEKRHRLLMQLKETKEEDGVERYRKVILACQQQPKGEL